MLNNPLVSVLMTAYNREQFVGEAIESVLSSTYPHFELIIVDDASTDNTVSVVRNYALKDSRIKLFINDKNLGDYPNRNKAASLATADLLMTVDSDDLLLEQSIENCVELLKTFPTSQFGITNDSITRQPMVMHTKDAIHQHFFKAPIFMKGPGGTIIKRDFFKQIGGYPEKYGPANDLYFNLKAAAQAGVLLIPFELINYRRHEGQEINNSYSYLYNGYRYLRDALLEIDLPLSAMEKDWIAKKNKRRFAVNVSRYCLRTASVTKSREAIKLADFSFRDFMQAVFH